jgi:hypothetical protein
MPNLTIKDLPERVHIELKNAARSQGRSLNGYVVSLLEMTIEERFRRKLMRAGRDDFRKFLSTLPQMSDSTKLIREDRDRGHR